MNGRLVAKAVLQWAAPVLLVLFCLSVLAYFMAVEGTGQGRAGGNAFAPQNAEAQQRKSAAGPPAVPGKAGFPEESRMVEAASSGRWTLRADPDTGHFLVSDRETGSVWRSYPNPDGWTEEGLTAAWKIRMFSPFMFSYVDAPVNWELEQPTDLLAENGKTEGFATIEGGFRVRYRIERLGLAVPVEVKLKDGYVETRIPRDGVQASLEGIALVSLRLYPFFGAETSRKTGFLLVPDGSGALIDFTENTPAAVNYYHENVYGEDRAYSYNQQDSGRLPVRWPVFGLKSGDQAFLGVITDGAAEAAILAAPSRSFNPYNWITPEYEFRRKYFQPTTTSRDQGVLAYPDEEIRTERATRYYLLAGGNPDYPEMAGVFRDYLQQEAGLGRTPAGGEKLPLHLTLLGADTAEGFWRDGDLALTTAGQATEIVKELSMLGVDAMSVVYKGWERDGYSRYGAHFPVNPAIGGNEGMRRFVRFAHGKGFQVLLDAEAYSYNRTGAGGFRKSRDGLRDLSSTVIEVEPAEGTKAVLAGPQFVRDKILRDLDRAADLEVDGLLFGGAAGSRPDSDFRDRLPVTREQSMALQRDAIRSAAQRLGTAAVADGAMYAMDLAGHLEGLHADYSYDMFVSRSVPFAQLALHGLVSYTLEYANLSDDYRKSFLKGIEYGAEPSFLVTYAPSYELLRSKSLSEFYSTHYKDWLVEMVTLYQRYNDAMEGLRDKRMTGHRQLADGVYETVYENGTRIVVNYGEQPYASNGLTVPPGDYAVEEGGSR